MMDTAGQGEHDTMHWGCCWMPGGGKILWILSFLALIGGLISLWQGGEFYGVSYTTWYWNALVGGVLSIGAKMMSHHRGWKQKQGQ